MSKIEWTDETWNVVTGCTRVSPGCEECYMFALYPRLRGMRVPGYEQAPDVVQLHHGRLDTPLGWKKPRFVFVNSMSDTFHPRVPFSFVTDLFHTMVSAPEHTFQLLTKRPGRAVGWWNQEGEREFGSWPDNVWVGTSVESQKYAPRLDVLARVPAKVRFASVEPLLEALDISSWLADGVLQWVIVGGESGPRARPMDPDWARALRDQCSDAGVRFFLKQLGGRTFQGGKRAGDEALLDGVTHREMPAVHL